MRWDEAAAATPHGQLMFFAEFLAATGVFERWVSSCPLSSRSGNAPDKRDVLGTLMLGLQAGHRRYAHITALRGDAVAAQALGMARVVSEDALRRALERIDEANCSRISCTSNVRVSTCVVTALPLTVSEMVTLNVVSSRMARRTLRAQAGCRFFEVGCRLQSADLPL